MQKAPDFIGFLASGSIKTKNRPRIAYWETRPSVKFPAMSPGGSQWRKLSASVFIGLSGQYIDAAEVKARLEERDRQAALDTRTEAERWLNDPPPGRSALAQRRSTHGTRAARIR
jgi:hypothetical protein